MVCKRHIGKKREYFVVRTRDTLLPEFTVDSEDVNFTMTDFSALMWPMVQLKVKICPFGQLRRDTAFGNLKLKISPSSITLILSKLQLKRKMTLCWPLIGKLFIINNLFNCPKVYSYFINFKLIHIML